MTAADAGLRAPRRVFLIRGLAACAAASSLKIAPAQARAQLELEEQQAELIAKITSFVDWPASAGLSSGSSPFHVTVLGSSELAQRLRAVFTQLPPQGHPARVRNTESLGEIDFTHVLFVAASRLGEVAEVVQRFERSGTLTMGSAQGLCARGLAVNLTEFQGHLGFEINRVALRRAGLRASYHLLSRAHLVDGP